MSDTLDSSEWWVVSTPKMTFAVKIEGDLIVEGAPIMHRFIGQSAKNLGKWVRAQETESQKVSFTKLGPLPYTFSWGNNEKRALLKGRPCRVLARGTMRSVMIEFADGQREIVSIRALKRKENNDDR